MSRVPHDPFETRIRYGEEVLTRLDEADAGKSLRAERETFRVRHDALTAAARATPTSGAPAGATLTDVALGWDAALRRLSDRARSVLAGDVERHRAIFGGPRPAAKSAQPRPSRATTKRRRAPARAPTPAPTQVESKPRAKSPTAQPPKPTAPPTKRAGTRKARAKAKANPKTRGRLKAR